MKKIKLFKKEYLVLRKDELNPILFDLTWRLRVSRTTSEIIATLKDEEAKRIEIEYLDEKINECCELLEKFEESL